MDWETLTNPPRLAKTYPFPNFRKALEFANRIGALAEEAGHHPRLTVEWGRVHVEWWTHSAGGITEKDREMARKTDEAYQALS